MCYNNKYQEGKEIGKIPRGPMNNQKDLEERDPRIPRDSKNNSVAGTCRRNNGTIPACKGGMTYVNAYGLDE